ncbi:MAG: hypothetical protein M9887_00540 [Chitinophagales bacterium]|nr:hypothetical protein [Chitinophagales bacterium]
MFRLFLLLALLFPGQKIWAFQIDIEASQNVLHQTVVKYTLDDFSSLLLKAQVENVSVNGNKNVKLVILLPDIQEEKYAKKVSDQYPIYAVKDRSYQWTGRVDGNAYTLELKAYSYEGISAALYGLLQEVLGFSFYHPRESVIPDLSKFPFAKDFEYGSNPRFNKMGFHLHLMHPIELTEALLDEDFPNGEQRIKEYIDWLARNRQNYFEFNLLNSINLKKWIPYAQKWTAYMLERGIMPGADLSLNMKQQYAFKLYEYPPIKFRTKKKQVFKRVQQLAQIPWKYWNMEFSSTEFSSGNAKMKSKLRVYVHQLLRENKIQLAGREHVVKPETMVNKNAFQGLDLSDSLEKYRANFIHTVMFYTLNDSLAPVYGNKNLQHMRNKLLHEQEIKETWYHPESAYWITFDNTIPMFLTPYLNARLEDILYCDTQKVEGHLEFSSGWEWGYWLVDWSVANWSWSSEINGKKVEAYPTQYFDKIVKDQSARDFFLATSQLQDTIIKAQNLIQFLTAATVTDEMPFDKNLPLHPMPPYLYKDIRNKISLQVVDSLYQHTLPLLVKYDSLYQSYRSQLGEEVLRHPVVREMVESLDITALRARHRTATLKYLLQYRKASLENNSYMKNDALRYLEQAKKIRLQALEIVRDREANYRYPVEELAYQRPSKTVYNFGYLYTAHRLHFWEREEGQALNNKYTFRYQNIWDVLKIIGLK